MYELLQFNLDMAKVWPLRSWAPFNLWHILQVIKKHFNNRCMFMITFLKGELPLQHTSEVSH